MPARKTDKTSKPIVRKPAKDTGAQGKAATTGVELEFVEDLDERQIAAWMKHVAAGPGVGGRKR